MVESTYQVMPVKLKAVHFPVQCSHQKLLGVVQVKIGQGVDVALGSKAKQVNLTQAERKSSLEKLEKSDDSRHYCN